MKSNLIDNIAKSILREAGLLLTRKPERLIIALDGRCAAGKTTLAAHLQNICGCNVIHMDHFFLRPEQRTAARHAADGNVDYERVSAEVLSPLKRGEAFSYRPYDCRRGELASAVQVEPRTINVIEGSYSCHPTLYGYYDLTVFLTVAKKEQLHRIKNRNGADADRFINLWIPMEEQYFSHYNIKERCLCFRT